MVIPYHESETIILKKGNIKYFLYDAETRLKKFILKKPLTNIDVPHSIGRFATLSHFSQNQILSPERKGLVLVVMKSGKDKNSIKALHWEHLYTIYCIKSS